MKGLFLNKKKSKKLILFFNGWSLDEKIVNHLTSSNYDVIMFCDYSDLVIPEEIIKEINSYEEVNIIAWSFGVWGVNAGVNAFLLQESKRRFNNVIAINGTLIPIDKTFGIPEKIFDLTLSNLSEKNYPRFFKNMFAGEPDLSKFPSRSIENQRQELIQIKILSLLPPPLRGRVGVGGNSEGINLFTKIFIGMNDKIIPAQNQINSWGQRDDLKIIKTNSGHYLFDLFKTWDEIIDAE